MRSHRSAGRLTGLVVGAVLLASCSSSNAAGPEAPVSSAVSPTATVTWTPTSGARQLLDGFHEVTVHIRQPDGSVRDVCLLLATDDAQRERGLMFVTDPALGGHGGMLFRFERDDQGGFWMKNTLLPLSIAYLDSRGAIVSSTDMEPCPTSTASCPTYPPAGPYRDAVEVPKGRLADLGLTDGATLTVGDEGCS